MEFPDLSVKTHRVSLGNGFAKAGFKNTAMERRWKESPKVRAEIEKKAMSVAPHFNKGPEQYMSPGDKTKYVPKVRK